jgi:hypothetical protein
LPKLSLKGKISKEKADKVSSYLEISLAIVLCLYFIVLIGVYLAWLSLGFWIYGLVFFALYINSYYRSKNRQLFKKLLGFILLCILFATPIFAFSATLHDQTVANNIQNQKTIDYFKSQLGKSYNYTELIVWENSQLNFSGAQRSDDPIKIYENHQGMCGEFATLYAELCISQGYRCRIVDNIFNDHMFNEVLLSNGTWIRVDASLNSTSPRAVGYPMFFEKEAGWLPPVLALAFENSAITEVTSTYRSDGFEMLSPTTLIVLFSLFALLALTIRNELLRSPKTKPTEDSSSEEAKEISEQEEKERDQLIYEIIVKRHDQELQRTSDLDTKANNTSNPHCHSCWLFAKRKLHIAICSTFVSLNCLCDIRTSRLSSKNLRSHRTKQIC